MALDPTPTSTPSQSSLSLSLDTYLGFESGSGFGMGEGRRVSSWKSSQGHHRSPKHWRPPPHPGSWRANIPWWERKFLASVCPIPLQELGCMRSSMSIYKNVLEWDDSAALEAFQKAKARFWAKINGLKSDISLPDPDMYIDKVNHDAVIDPELIEDLYKEPPAPANQDPAPFSIFEPVPRSTSWDVHIEKSTGQDGASDANNSCSGWDVNAEWPCNDGWTDGFARNEERGNKRDSLWDNSIDKSWGPCQSNNESGGRYSRKRYRGGHFGSRFQMDDCQRNNNSWRNCRGRNNRIHYNEHTVYTRQSTSQMRDPGNYFLSRNNR